MGLPLMDRSVDEADAPPGNVGGRQSDMIKGTGHGRMAWWWERRDAVVERVGGLLFAVSSRAYEQIDSGWTRILDRNHTPRRWWWPPEAKVPLDHDDLQRQHAQCSETINRLLFTLLGFCFFCLLTLGGSDAVLLGAGGPVAVPVVNLSLSNVAFLKVGPLILIALSLYLHILWERLLRYEALDADRRLPYIFNLCDPISKLLSQFLVYWMVPVVLALFACKAGPRPEGSLLGSVAMVVTMLLIWLQMRRCPEAKRHWNIPRGVALIALLALFPFMVTGQIPLNRSLHLYEAPLAKMDLSGFDLRGANLSRANLQGAFLSKADLREANLQNADLSNAILAGARLDKAQLSWAKGLTDADLRDVVFEEANLTETDLRGAYLSGAHLRSTSLYQADLRGADLEGAIGLTREQVDSARIDDTTRLPSYLLGVVKQGS